MTRHEGKQMMNSQNAINEIHALVANSEVNDEVAEKLLAIAYWLEAELSDECCVAASEMGVNEFLKFIKI